MNELQERAMKAQLAVAYFFEAVNELREIGMPWYGCEAPTVLEMRTQDAIEEALLAVDETTVIEGVLCD